LWELVWEVQGGLLLSRVRGAALELEGLAMSRAAKPYRRVARALYLSKRRLRPFVATLIESGSTLSGTTQMRSHAERLSESTNLVNAPVP